ncbi:MAG TPA: malonate decarboxylase acyl carrier protein [Anaeromyxobacter sp.]|nr:malonate decarboxylase acyl carrier protein [Anaeromyxobacter sp.]
MERLELELPSARSAAAGGAPVVVGVVASGNLEVLVERGGTPDRCRFEVSTSVHGFGAVWRAVLEDFAARRAVAGLAFSVNDAGATPAVVTLRLEQAAEEFLGAER